MPTTNTGGCNLGNIKGFQRYIREIFADLSQNFIGAFHGSIQIVNSTNLPSWVRKYRGSNSPIYNI